MAAPPSSAQNQQRWRLSVCCLFLQCSLPWSVHKTRGLERMRSNCFQQTVWSAAPPAWEGNRSLEALGLFFPFCRQQSSFQTPESTDVSLQTRLLTDLYFALYPFLWSLYRPFLLRHLPARSGKPRSQPRDRNTHHVCIPDLGSLLFVFSIFNKRTRKPFEGDAGRQASCSGKEGGC